MSSTPTLENAKTLLEAGQKLLGPALDRARKITEGGRAIDDHQVLTERVAYAATEERAARELYEFNVALKDEGRGDELREATCAASSTPSAPSTAGTTRTACSVHPPSSVPARISQAMAGG